MGRVETSLVLRAAVQDVAAFCADPKQFATWFHLMDQFQSPEPLKRTGVTFSYQMRVLGSSLSGQGRVVRALPGGPLVLASEDPMARWTWTMEFGRRGRRTRMTLASDYAETAATRHRIGQWTLQQVLYHNVEYSLKTLAVLMEDPNYVVAALRTSRPSLGVRAPA